MKFSNILKTSFEAYDATPELQEFAELLKSYTKDTKSNFLDTLSTIYIDAFGGDMWKEGYKCAEDDCNFQCTIREVKTEVVTCCSDCGGDIETFYTTDDVAAMLQSVTQKDIYKLLLSKNSETDDIVGFQWGWTATSLEELNEEKLGLDSTALQELQEVLQRVTEKASPSIYYYSETAVLQSSRGNSLSSKMTQKLEESFDEMNKPDIILTRTSENSSQKFVFAKNGYRRVYDYPDGTRFLLIKTL